MKVVGGRLKLPMPHDVFWHVFLMLDLKAINLHQPPSLKNSTHPSSIPVMSCSLGRSGLLEPNSDKKGRGHLASSRLGHIDRHFFRLEGSPGLNSLGMEPPVLTTAPQCRPGRHSNSADVFFLFTAVTGFKGNLNFCQACEEDISRHVKTEKSAILYWWKKTASKEFGDTRNIFEHFLPAHPILLQCQNVSP